MKTKSETVFAEEMYCGAFSVNAVFLMKDKENGIEKDIENSRMEKRMEKAVLFFDIDGTLLSEVTKEIPDSAVEALRRAKDAGHLLFINTGRTVCSIPAEIRRLPFDGYLCGCGTCIVYHDEILFQRSLSRERGRAVIEKMFECSLGGVAEGPEDVYFPERISRFDKLETTRRYFRAKGMGIECSMERGDFIYDKLFIYADGKSDLGSFLAFIDEDMEAMDRGGNAYEVIQKGYSKATACEFIVEKLGFTKDQAYVFGDSSNDLAMFEYADHAVAMGEHAAVLEPYTEYVTKTVEEDGIFHAMRHYGLI